MEYIVHILIMFGIFAILAMTLNLVVGYTGLLSIAHAAFFGIGAYTTAILTTQYEYNFLIAAVIGMGITIIVALIIGTLLSRFKDDYFTLVSLGFTVIMYSIFLNWQDLTRGPLGIPGIPRPDFLGIDFSSNVLFLGLVMLVTLLVYASSHFIASSSFGRILKTIREDEKAIQVFGYNTAYFKLSIFVITAMLAASAGSLFAVYITYIDPSSFTLSESAFILAIVILGGSANLKGSVLGALFLVMLPEALRFVGLPNEIAGQARQLIYGVLLVGLMMYRPQGLLGEYKL